MDLAYVSTRSGAAPASLSEAMQRGLAPDGGLYMPQQLPQVDVAGLVRDAPLYDLAAATLRGFFAGDVLESALPDITREALDFSAPVTRVLGCDEPLYALELFHGVTAAFKDFGARFLAASLQRLQTPGSQPLTILVATSGDTGGAVAAAFHQRPWVRVIILYPKGMVSPRQERQLTCWGGNVSALRIDGTFDDCQRLVKTALGDAGLSARHRFSSANSINIGRLLPQMMYYASSSLGLERTAGAPSYIIPAGNLGNALAAVWARAIGFPIRRIVLAHNANRTVPDYLRCGEWLPRPSVATLASAMDVGNPSNMERLRALFPNIDAVREQVSAESVDDATIRARIKEDFMHYGREWCPHTATAAEVYARLERGERRNQPWVVVATAHPAKFNEIVEPIIGKAVAVPASLARLLQLPQQLQDLPPSFEALTAALE